MSSGNNRVALEEYKFAKERRFISSFSLSTIHLSFLSAFLFNHFFLSPLFSFRSPYPIFVISFYMFAVITFFHPFRAHVLSQQLYTCIRQAASLNLCRFDEYPDRNFSIILFRQSSSVILCIIHILNTGCAKI
jgi:hypothetical protein